MFISFNSKLKIDIVMVKQVVFLVMAAMAMGACSTE